MKPDVLLVWNTTTTIVERLNAHFTVHRLPDEAAPRRAKLAAIGNRIRAIATMTLVGADRALIEALPNLEFIACSGGHVDRIDLAACRERGIRISNTPNMSFNAVAEQAIGLALAVSRQLVAGDRFVRAGRWLDGAMPFGRLITGKRLGIVGLGHVGRAIARRAEGFEMDVRYHGPRRKDAPYAYYADPVALAADVDILALSCPGGAATRHLVDRRVLDALGSRGILINVARGSVVDEPALIAALREGRIAGAGLDVFPDEPRVAPELIALDNVVLEPHTGGDAAEIKDTQAALTVDNLRAFFAGQPLLTPVDLDRH